MKALGWLGWAAAALLGLYVSLYALRYLAPGFSGPEFIMANGMAHPWLPVHAGAAAVALAIGTVQLLPAVRRRAPAAHRWLGRAFVALGLVAGGSGLVLALGTTAGPAAMTGFFVLAVLVLAGSIQAWRHARARRFDAHRAWAVRSYALMFAGVTLRLWLPLVFVTGLEFMPAYNAIAWLCWVPNLIVAEIYLAGRRRAPSPRFA